MTVHIVGTCGNCGGPVEIPQAWFGIYPPTPTCRSCGATPKEAFGRRLPMNPSPRRGSGEFMCRVGQNDDGSDRYLDMRSHGG
jgi:hypothetical protein